jgi:gliding motility-associated-like protein
MDISVNDFNNIVSMQYSMSFDPNELEFQSIEVTGNLSGLAVSNFGTNDAPNGSLTVSWLDPNVAGITLADGTVIYQVCFKVLGSCGTLTNFEFVNSPTVIEVTDGDGNLVNFDSNPGVVDICGTTPDASISINASDYKADEGESFCIDISVSDFDNIASLEYSMEFDATKVEFQSIQLTNNLTGLDISDFVTTNASNGVLTLSWQEASGITIADGTVIYQVCFKSLAACGTASSNFDFTNTPTAISVTDGNGDSVNLSSNNGTISFCDDITPPPPAPDEFMVASDHQPLEGEDFCMDISVNDFTNIVSMQYSMSFDPNELEFQSIQVPGNLDGLAVSNFGVNDAGNGIITVSWLDPNVSGITLADGTIIFQVCFKTLGSCGTVTNFEFTDSPTVIEITDGDGNIVDFSSDPGIVDICGAPAIPFILTAAQNDVPEGETVCIPITAQGFEDIVSMQYTITFDPALFEFTGTQAYNLVDLAASNFGISNVSNGVITFSWLDSTTGGVTVPDNTAIYEICFKAIGNVGDVSPVTFSSNPTTIEIGKPNGTIVPTLNNGSVTIITGCPGPIIYDPNITEIQNVSCNGGTDGVIDITIDGGDGSYTYEWKNNSGVVVSTAPNFVGGAGTYSLSVSSCGDNVSISETFTLTEPDAIDVIVTSVQDVDCFGDQNGFIMTDPSGGTSSYTYAWSNGGANISQFSLAGGMYTFTVTDSKGCEYTSDFIEVLEPAELIATASVVNPPCFGDNGSISVAANGGSLTYEYSNDNGGTWQTSSSFTNVTEGTYKVLVRDNKGCVTTISPDVVVDAPDELSITLNSTFDSGNCIGSAAVQVSGGNAITDYFWSGPNSNYFNSPNQSGLCAGQHCVIVQDVNGCQTSECVYVSRQLIIAGTVTNACWGINNGEISVLAQGGVPPNPTYTYVWDPQVPNPGSPTQVGLSPGTYCVTVTSMPDNQMETMCFNVSQAAEPVQIGNADLNDPTGPNLFNGSIQVSGITGGFGGPYTYKWDPNLGSGPVLNNLDEGAYNLTVCDVNGCNISASYVLEIVPTALQFSTFDFQDANCSDSNDGTFTFAISGGLPNYSVTVTGPSGQVYSNLSLVENQVITIDNLPSGNYTINADFNVAGYTGDIDANFTIDAPAPIVIESLKIQNATEDAAGRIFIDIEGGDSPYTYFWNNASTSKDLFDVQPGPYSVTVTDQSSCTAEFGPFVVDLFEVDGATTVDVDCPNEETGSITPNIVGVAGDPTCEWVGPNGEIYNTCNLVDLASGIYTLVVTDTCGVETPEYQFEIQANSDISVVLNPTTNSNGVNIACFGGSDGGAIAVVTGGLPPLDYIWSNGETDQEISNIPAGNYSVTVIDALGCEDNADAILTEPLEALSAELGGVVSPSCTGAQNGSATIIVSGGTPFPGANPYLYQWNDTQSQTGPTAILLKAGDYAVTVTDRNGCQVIVPVTIADPDKMEVTITTTCDNGDADGTALANVFGGTGPFQFTWSNADTAQFITGLTAGTYFVEVSDGNGCQATDINGGFVCPNFGCFEARTVITPDGDGRNEEFIIGCTSRFPNNTLEIFNRWGQLVFETDDYVCEEADLDGCWEGTNARGDDLPEGVYFYIFDYTDPVTNEEDQKKGSVTILRQ